MEKKILLSLMMVGVVAAAAGAGTFAYFSDTESSNGNTMTAGTLDLNIEGGDSAVTTLSVSDVGPGDSGTASSSISNTGSIDGYVDVEVGSVNNTEGANPESETDTSGDGEMGGIATATIYVDDDGNLSTTGDQTQVASGTLNSIQSQDYEVDHSLTAGGSSNLVIDWDVPTSMGNEAQGDAASFDATAKLDQTAGQ